jgi:hypothetical protein
MALHVFLDLVQNILFAALLVEWCVAVVSDLDISRELMREKYLEILASLQTTLIAHLEVVLLHDILQVANDLVLHARERVMILIAHRSHLGDDAIDWTGVGQTIYSDQHNGTDDCTAEHFANGKF